MGVDPTAPGVDSAGETDQADDGADDPTIEEDLVTEELRIDGICGVY